MPTEDEYLSLLRQVEVPSALVFGETSPLVGPHAAARLAQALRSTRLVGVPGGHTIHYEQAGKVARLIGELAGRLEQAISAE